MQRTYVSGFIYFTKVIFPAKYASVAFIQRQSCGWFSIADPWLCRENSGFEQTVDTKARLSFFYSGARRIHSQCRFNPNDILIVDSSTEPVPGKIAIFALIGELTVKRLECDSGQ